MSFVGRENLYTCQKCGGSVTTIDADEGTTPFMMVCRARPEDAAVLLNEGTKRLIRDKDLKCGGFMQSAFYPRSPRPPHISAPTFEWYRPAAEEYEGLSRMMREDHVDKGGLLIRPITEKGLGLMSQ